MDNRRPIDIKRESGGSSNIGTEEDGRIEEMFEFGDSLMIVKTKALYTVTLADQIDPKRENPDLPHNVQRRVLNLGWESELVARTLLTAQRLLDKDKLQTSINTKGALVLAFEALLEMAAMQTALESYKAVEEQVCAEYEERRLKKVSYEIPSISDVKTRCKTFFQKADHTTQTLMEIITLFYPNSKLHKQAHFETFWTMLKKEYGEEDNFSKYLEGGLPFIKLIRATRNSLDHRLPDVKVMDFEIRADGSVLTPTIEIDFRGNKQERTSLYSFISFVFEDMIAVFEATLAHLCNKHVRTDRLPYRVVTIPEDRRRRNKHITIGYYLNIGEGGFYEQ